MPLFSIVQAFATLAAGLVVGLVYVWKIGLVGFGTYRHSLFFLIDADYLTSACVPFLISTGYIRLVGGSESFS
jgi:ATP-binding cassette, subfamily B (MDR/TAP), member 1